ncbi:MAG: hypothetical protein ABIH00_02520 [Armatimonadota bacterium]
MHKKIAVIIIAISILLSAAISADESSSWQVSINGKTTAIEPLTVNSEIYLPLVQIAEQFNFKINTDPAKKIIFINFKNMPADAPSSGNADEYGSIIGNVKFNITEESSMNFNGREAVLTAVADKPFTEKELKNHFYGGQSSYFYHHFPVYETKINKDGNFTFANVKPGEYDLLVFNKDERPFGFKRVAWKMYMDVEPDQNLKIKLDNYNTAVDDFVYLQRTD